MRILIILKYIPSQTNDRKADAISTTVKAHEAAGYDVVLLTTGREEKHNWESISAKELLLYQKLTIKVISFISKKLAEKIRRALVINGVVEYHKSKKIDATLAYCTSGTPAILAASIKKRLGIPYFIYEHRNYERAKKTINDIELEFRCAVKKADHVVAVSPQLANNMKLLGLKQEIGCLPLAISNRFFDPPKKQNTFRRWADNAFLFAAWSRWRNIKRLDLLIKAYAIVLKNRQNVKLAVVGPIETSEQQIVINKLIAKNNIEQDVMLYGVANREEIHLVAHACDCYVLTSDYETFGLPVLEAIAAGKPVVATKCGGPESIITSDQLGCIVEKGDAEVLAKAMIEVHDKINSFNQKEIRDIAYKNYSEDAIVKQWVNVYQAIMEYQ